MSSAIIVKSRFSRKYEKDENFLSILGKPLHYYLNRTCQDLGLDVVSFDEIKDENMLVLSESTPQLDEESLRTIRDSKKDLVFYNGQGQLLAFHCPSKRLREVGFKENDTFEDLIEKLDLDKEVEIFNIEYSYGHVLYIDTLIDFAEVEVELSQKECHKWMERGVRIDSPESVRISPDSSIGSGTWIQANVSILDGSEIGEDCLIMADSKIFDSKIGNNVKIISSYIESSIMEDGSDIGPYSHLRPKAHLKENVHIGNFVEVKNAVLGQGSKAGHLAYIGDADVGDYVNIGCGVIFVNYDGKKKHRSTVGDRAFIGSNANLVAPVLVEEEGYIAAGSTITKEVAKGALAVERAKQRNIDGYVEKKKKAGLL